MSRLISQRICVTGKLEAQTPLHFGGLRESAETDMPLAVDGQGRLYAPGSSIAGAASRVGRAELS